jgi:hypothetical protein
METLESVSVCLSQNPVHLVVEAVARRRTIPRIDLEILRDRIDPLAEHFA